MNQDNILSIHIKAKFDHLECYDGLCFVFHLALRSQTSWGFVSHHGQFNFCSTSATHKQWTSFSFVWWNCPFLWSCSEVGESQELRRDDWTWHFPGLDQQKRAFKVSLTFQKKNLWWTSCVTWRQGYASRDHESLTLKSTAWWDSPLFLET